MKKSYSFALGLIFAFAINTSAQIPGMVDSSFNGNGKVIYDFGFHENLTDVKVQPFDQKVVTVGTALTPSFSGKLLAIRLLPNGAFDTTFNDSGIVVIPNFNESYAYETIIKDDGKILIAGTAADPNFIFSTLCMQLNSDGSLDSTFGINGFATPRFFAGDEFANGMALQADGKIVLAGSVLDAGGHNMPSLVRLNQNGSLDTTFGVGGVAIISVTEIDNKFNNVFLQADGKIVASGHFDQGLTLSGQFDFDILVARFTADGIIDSTFGTSGITLTPVSVDYIEDALGMKQSADGGIVISGFTTLPDFSFDMILVKYDSVGVLVPTFGSSGIVQFDNDIQDVGYDVTIQSNGKILVGGTSGGFFFDDRDFLLMRYDANGQVDTTFGNDGLVLTPIMNDFDEANAITLQADGKIILAGKANNGSQNDLALVRYWNDVSTGISEINQSTTVSLYPNPTKSGNSIVIEWNESASSNIQLMLMDGFGRTIDQIQIKNQGTDKSKVVYQFPSTLSNGFYLVNLIQENGSSITAKVMIQN